jgi:predicted SnoaL-like aldol condensation-catalyzing enzyme
MPFERMPLTDLWRVKDGKLIEHWDEFNLPEVFQEIAAARARKAEGP